MTNSLDMIIHIITRWICIIYNKLHSGIFTELGCVKYKGNQLVIICKHIPDI